MCYRMRNYLSNISREEFEKIREDLEGARKKTKPRKMDLYEVFCAVLYVLKSGCQWDMLPSDFPKKSTVQYYFQIWTKKPQNQGNQEDTNTILDTILKKLVGLWRIGNGKLESTSFCIVDAQSVQNTDTAKEKGYDAAKKVSGIRRPIAVDTNGLPQALFVTTANISDKAGAILMIENNRFSLPCVRNILCDGGYRGNPFADRIRQIIGATVTIIKRNAPHQFEILPKRWIVERTFGWLDKCRRLWKNCERTLHISHQMMVSAFISLILKRF